MRHTIFFLLSSMALMASCAQPTQQTKPIRKDVIETVFGSGVLEAHNTYQLTAQNDGYLVALKFEEGDLIQQGQVLAIIDNIENDLNAKNAEALYDIALRNTQMSAPTLLQAQIAIDNAKQKLAQDRIQEQRYKRLLEKNSIAQNDYETVLLSFETAKTNYESAVQQYKKLEQEAQQQVVTNQTQKKVNQAILGKNLIRAVVSGKVYQKLKQPGDFVKRGEIIATLGDPDFIYAQVNIDEGSIAKVKIGQEALVQLNTQKTKAYKAQVWKILPSFDEAQQSFICQLKFKEPLDFSIVKTQLQSNITVDTQRNALLIPRNFLEYGGYVRLKGQAQKVKVETNFVSSDWVQVLAGMDENAVLITTNIVGTGKASDAEFSIAQ